MRIGVDLGGTSIKVGLVSDNGIIVNKLAVPTGAHRDVTEICNDIADAIRKTADGNDFSGIGIGSPGMVDNASGTVLRANNFAHNPLRLKDEISKAFPKIPVAVDNDASCAALAESLYGAAIGAGLSILITLGTGVGCGIVQDGKLWRGAQNKGGELGHMVVHTNGESCTCGRKGCLEAYASATALIRDTTREAKEGSLIYKTVNGDLSKITAKTPFDLAKQGDPTCIAIVNNYLHYLSEGIANISNLFNPECIILGGGVSNEGTALTDRLSLLIQDKCFSNPPRIIKAALGNDAGIIGAASL